MALSVLSAPSALCSVLIDASVASAARSARGGCDRAARPDTVGGVAESVTATESVAAAAQRAASWQPASAEPGHALARWDGAVVGPDLTLEAWLGPRNSVGARYFRLYLRSAELGRPAEPVVFGLQAAGPYPGFNWVEVIEYRDRLPLDGTAREVLVPAGVERLIFGRLAELVPPGGHLMAEYDSPARRSTARALAASVPPRATPLGATLAAVGCAVALRDWYIAEGGREGPRKLQGFRALNAAHARTRARETIAALEAFLARSASLEWDLQAQVRPLAQQAIAELHATAV
ncbi:MAG: DUF1122 domain-containing protein [Dehalococcoidia bacterium]|nr:DUF1122 domain-containing protein [Dehalococcoidia bacterium]